MKLKMKKKTIANKHINLIDELISAMTKYAMTVELVHSMPAHVVALKLLNKVKGSFTKYSTRFNILS